MARNWLAFAELPAKLWFYAVKCAAEVCYYFPAKLDNNVWTTSFEMAQMIKPDLGIYLNFSVWLLFIMNIMEI